MKKDINIDPEVQKVMSDYAQTFNPFFVTRVMGKIEHLNDQIYASGIYDLFFRRVVVSGVFAIAAMLILTVVLNGGFSVDALLGIGDLEMENAIAMSITDF